MAWILAVSGPLSCRAYLLSSLNAGVSGLSANASRLASISDNIANASTYGYRRAETEFKSLYITIWYGRILF